ncbi:MAG TPA: conjugal transfer protein TrbL family protein [Candidatus Nanopelagicaceae bacterium]|nr:conjugal transfer protein TrbL family protein [Candidatus Nanopelagicaceae bacterium]
MVTGAGVALPAFSFDPLAMLLHLLSGALSDFVSQARGSLDSALAGYLFGTYDAASPGSRLAFTRTPGLAPLNHLLVLAGGALVAAIFIYSSLRTVGDAGGSQHHQLQVVLPRVLLALALAALSLPLIQQLIDLNNALCSVVVGGAAVNLGDLPWSSPLSAPAVASAADNIFLLLFAGALVLAVVILALAYVVRYTLLAVLCASAPLAATCWILPETRGFARQWSRLLVVALFMQFGQLLVLRVAIALAFARGQGVTGMLYAFSCLYLMLRVPGALNVATHFESSAEAAGRRWSRAVRRLAASEV